MTIKITSFLALDASLTTRISGAVWAANKDTYESIGAALQDNDFPKARSLVASISMEGVFVEVENYVSFITNMAMLFGASRVTPDPGTSVVGLGYEATASSQAVQSFGSTLTVLAEQNLRDRAMQLIALEEGAKELDLIAKADRPRIVKNFSSFMDGAGKAYMNVVSSLHTSRVSAYGFVAEAEAMGYDEYQINEQLDNRTCPVCAHMHGKVFKVKKAKQLLDVALRVKSPEDLRHIQPWPLQDKESLKLFTEMGDDELVANNWHIPPYHPGCRGLLVRSGKAPSIDDLTNGTTDISYKSSEEDFKSLGLRVTEEQLSQWNSFSDMSPIEMVSRLEGTPLAEFAAGLVEQGTKESLKSYTGITSFKVGTSTTISILKEVYGVSEKLTQVVKFNPSKYQTTLKTLSMEGGVSDSVMGQYLLDLVGVSRDVEFESLAVKVGTLISPEDSLRYGFLPDRTSWNKLRVSLASKVKTNPLWQKLSQAQLDALKELLTSDDPGSILKIASTADGVLLLSDQSWLAVLDFKDAESMSLFLKATKAVK